MLKNGDSGKPVWSGPGAPDPELSESELIYDWNSVEKTGPLSPRRHFTFFDETLRDGIQSPSVVDPKIEDKILFTQIASDLGVHHIDIGLPGAGPRAVEDCITLASYIRDNRLPIKAACAARTHVKDVQAVVDVSQKVGMPIEVMAFIGSSPIRAYAEDWDIDLLVKRSAEAIDLAVKNGLPCTYVTEDTTRSRPEVLDRLFRNAVEHGAHRLCLCDTVGHATPDGIRNLLRFTRNLLDGMGRREVGIDWHGHNDRGLGVVNTIFAIEYGADRAHGTALGLGERVGNAALDQVMLNLKLLGELPGYDLSKLLLWCRVAARACHVNISPQYPLAGYRCVPHRHRGPCRRHHQGRAQGPSLAGRPHLLGRARGDVRARAGDRDRALLGRVERDLLAAEARVRSGARAGAQHPGRRQARQPGLDR